VETRAQLDYLSSLGCDAYQGFLFSRPVAVDKATDLLARQKD
jgi:EAL domain-containing protein (putative c-di-GMP-specific phosphodiesterase class I)